MCQKHPTFVLVVLAMSLVTSLADVKSASLNGHNTYRRKEAKKENVSNMNALLWSDELADQAHTWAANCRWGHQFSLGYGENLYYRYPKDEGDDYFIKDALDFWMTEKEKFNKDKSFNCCNLKTSCCHYTQVVSTKSTHVGCALVGCDKLYDSQGNQVIAMNAAYVVCFYNPMGNMVINGDAMPYKHGKPCSACSGGQSCASGDSLCA